MLTNEERLLVYEKTLELISDKNDEDYCKFGLCYFMLKALSILKLYSCFVDPYNYMENYPEIFSRKSINPDRYWFPRSDVKSRITILENAIKELKDV